MGNLNCCSKEDLTDAASAAKSAGKYIGKNAGEAGQSLLDRVETKFGEVMDEVIHDRLAQKCDATFDKAVDTLVDKTFAMTFDKAFALIDDTIDGKQEEEENKYSDDIELTKTEKRKEAAIQKLKEWMIPQILINAMDGEGWLDDRNWDVLTKQELKNMGFGNGHITSFMNGMNGIKQKHITATQTLKKWGIKISLIDKMDEEGYLDESRWNILKDDEEKLKLKAMGFRYEDITFFLDGLASRTYEEPYDILQKWGISDESIEILAANRKLAERNWDELQANDLKKMKLPANEIKLFMDKKKRRMDEKQKARKTKIKRGNAIEADPSEILREWSIPNDLINKLKETGWLHPEYWNDLLTKEDELEDMGFKNGHISTFKRKFQEWRQKHFHQNKSKVNLSRQIGKNKPKSQSILKRNVDVQNSTNELIRVRIIGERKYGSYESSSNTESQHENKKTKRVNDQSSSSNIKSSKQYNSDSTNEQNKTLGVKVGASAVIPQAGMSTIGVDVGVNKTKTNKSTNKTSSAADDSRDVAAKSNQERLKERAQGSEQSQANTSQHEWDKVQVGFTDIMPKQTIVFPVQINNANAVVFMTIYRPSTKENVCENIQIDANFINIEPVKIDGFGDKIKWQPSIKPPVAKNSDKLRNSDVGLIAAEEGMIIVEGLCQFMSNKGVDEWIINAIKNRLGTAKYKVDSEEDMEALKRHVYNAVCVNIQFNGYYIPEEKYTEIKKSDSVERDDNKSNVSAGNDQESENKYNEDDKNHKNKDENVQLNRLIKHYVMTNCNVLQSKTANEDIESKYVELDSNKLCQFVRNLNIVADKKIDFIQDALSAKYDISNESLQAQLLRQIADTIVLYDELSIYTLNKRNKSKSLNFNVDSLVDEYIKIVEAIVYVGHDYDKQIQKYRETGYDDYDSDEEELDLISTFCDVDGHTILQKWGLQQFYERMVDEGWKNPLDWVHINDHVLKQSLGFRPGHIKIFNRKFDLWIRKYNEIRTSYITAKKKGKDGTLLVRSGETKILKSNHNYEFTKIVIRKGGRLTTEAWSPSHQRGGVLFITSHQELVLEEGAVISLSGKGYWGSDHPDLKGYGPGGGGSVYHKRGKCGAGGAAYSDDGTDGYTPEYLRHLEENFSADEDHAFSEDEDENDDKLRIFDPDRTEGTGGTVYGNERIDCLDVDFDVDFHANGDATDAAAKRHSEAMGSGGGCYASAKERIRGGTGGGAVKIVCDKLIMYEKSVIRADGYFDLTNANPLTSGGSGGSVWVTVNNDIQVHYKKSKMEYLFFRIEVEGGGMKQFSEKKENHLNDEKNDQDQDRNPVGIGAYGRIRIDFHTPWNLTEDGFKPQRYHVGGSQTEKRKKNKYELKHDVAVNKGVEIIRQGFVKVDHFDNIYRLKPKFEGAPNLRRVSGFNIYGTGQPNKSAILSLLKIWLKEMDMKKCLWINMRAEPVIYVNDFSLAPRDPKNPSENIDFLEEAGVITIDDLHSFNRELEKTVKEKIEGNKNIFEYHKDTYAPLPADRKDRVAKCKCNNGSNDVYGLESLYNNLNQKFNIELQRIIVFDEKAPQPENIEQIVEVISKQSADTVIVFNCMMGKGRTTEGMIMACLIKQIQNEEIKMKKKKNKNKNKNRWPNDIPNECEEFVSFANKLQNRMDEKKNENLKINEFSQLNEDDMKQGNFELITKLINILKKKYKLKGDQIKKETDDIIDRCQHLQNMRECIYLSLLRYMNESRQNQKEYWKKISKQYLQRYYILIVFNAYLNDVVRKQKKQLDQIKYTEWISDKPEIYNTIGSLISTFHWN